MLAEVPDWAQPLIAAAGDAGDEVAPALAAAGRHGALLPLPGSDTVGRWSVLAAIGAANLTWARVFEAHADALAILADAGEHPPEGSSWGVFAAEAAGTRVDAELAPDGQTATLSGTKPWCSLAGDLDAALVTAHTVDGRRLFRVDLRQPSVRPEPATAWLARGLRAVTSAPVHFDTTPAVPVGPAGWYLARPGFAWGGIGVAACWYGGAAGLVRAVRARAATTGADIDAMHLGGADAALWGARASLIEAARSIDDDRVQDAGLMALRVRSVVVDAVETILRRAAHALGPAPLAFDAAHSARVADLELYIRQHHGERDLVSLGRTVLDRDDPSPIDPR